MACRAGLACPAHGQWNRKPFICNIALKTICEFFVFSPLGDSSVGEVSLTSSAYSEVRKVFSPDDTGTYPHPDYAIKISEFEDSERLKWLFNLIACETGRRPTEKEYSSSEDWASPNLFRVRRCRRYDEQDLLSCELASWTAQWTGEFLPWLAELCAQEDECLVSDEQFDVEADVGWLQPNSEPVVSDKLKLILEAERFQGLNFREVRGRRQSRRLWQPWSSVEMPPVQLPKVNTNGLPYDGDLRAGLVFEDGAKLAELKFVRSDVEMLRPFDFAITCERVGANALLAFRKYVVSQRFRRTIRDLEKNARKLGLVMPPTAFIPVHLI